MPEEDIFIQMCISHYEAMLKLDLSDGDRSILNRLLVEAEQKREGATDEQQNVGTRRR